MANLLDTGDGALRFGADDGLVNVNITSVTQPDGEVGVFGIVVEFGGTHVSLVVCGCVNEWH